MQNSDEKELDLRFRKRITETVSLNIPLEPLTSLRKIATEQDMSLEALLKLYIGQGLRQDLAKAFSERVLDRTAEGLAHHLDSQDEVSAILQEIKLEVAG